MDTNTATQPQIDQFPSPTGQRLRVGPIIRDVAIILALTFIGGFVIGLAGPGTAELPMLAIAAANLLLGTIGFTISGCLAPGSRWRHLVYVAIGVWLASLINVVFYGTSIILWLFSSLPVALMMGLGGAFSYLFRKDAKPSA